MVVVEQDGLTGEALVERARFDWLGLAQAKLTGLEGLEAGHLVTFLEYAGSTLRELELSVRAGTPTPGSEGLDWHELTPQLEALTIRGFALSTSALTHPRLQVCKLRRCHLIGEGDVEFGGASDEAPTRLRELVMRDTSAPARRLSFGPRARIERLVLTSKRAPDEFFSRVELASCPQLEELRVTVERDLEVALRGRFPALDQVDKVRLEAPLGTDYQLKTRYLRGPDSLVELLT